MLQIFLQSNVYWQSISSDLFTSSSRLSRGAKLIAFNLCMINVFALVFSFFVRRRRFLNFLWERCRVKNKRSDVPNPTQEWFNFQRIPTGKNRRKVAVNTQEFSLAFPNFQLTSNTWTNFLRFNLFFRMKITHIRFNLTTTTMCRM